MAEILGFYDLLHSAGGCVSGVMCSDRLDLNSSDTEKERETKSPAEQRGTKKKKKGYHHRVSH